MIMNPATVTKTEYLYGIKPKRLAKMKYFKAIRFKLKKARNLICTLYDEKPISRDEDRIMEIFDAVKFNEKLLKEIR